jgi:hypothetical protein
MPDPLTILCPVCHGGCIPSEPHLRCAKCKNRGELPVYCECGWAAVRIVNDEAKCDECAKDLEEEETQGG